MKQFLKNHGLWILFAAAVIAVAMACMSYFSNTSSPLSNLAGTLASPFRAVYSAVTGWVEDKQAYFADVKALEEENAELKQQIAQMEADVRQAESDRAENDRLLEKIAQLRLVDRAKCYLIEHKGCTEADAHRLIEKQAMDTRRSRGEVAREILEEAESSDSG